MMYVLWYVLTYLERPATQIRYMDIVSCISDVTLTDVTILEKKNFVSFRGRKLEPNRMTTTVTKVAFQDFDCERGK